METLDQIIKNIRPGDPRAWENARLHWDSLAKPLGSLGVLEEDIIKIAALRGNENISLKNRRLVVFCADNGVIARGVSQSDETVTTAVAAALGRGDSTASYMARAAGCSILTVDIGMAEDTPEGVQNKKLRRGTDDIACGPAMTREECERAILAGAAIAGQAASDGIDILLTGEMGIGNTTTSTAVACALLGIDAEQVTGRGAGLSDTGLHNKIAAIRQAMEVNLPDPADPVDVLQKVGGLDLAAISGLCLGAALNRVPVLLDGMATNVAALCAAKLCPDARDAFLASHVSAEPVAQRILKELEIRPCISGGLRLGEGTGALLMLPLLDETLAVYHSGHTFGHLGIEAYTPQ